MGHNAPGCDVPAPQLPMVQFPAVADTPAEVCGIYSVEDNAYDLYATVHGYPEGDPRIAETGEPAIAGMIEGSLEIIASIESSDPTSLTADEAGAYSWLHDVDNSFQVTAAQDALNEYNKWSQEQCNYKPPNPTLFSYNPMDQPACVPQGDSFAGVLTGVDPPSYQEFKDYGVYEADQSLNLSNALGGVKNQSVVENGIAGGAGAVASILAGSSPVIAAQLGQGTAASRTSPRR